MQREREGDIGIFQHMIEEQVPVATVWCDPCMDHFNGSHYHPETGDHMVGEQYGRFGDLLAKEKELLDLRAGLKLMDDAKKPAVKDDWIQMTPAVRVLLEMPEQDALWLRNRLAKNRQDDPKGRSEIAVADGERDDAIRGLEMRILEILIYG
jgi:hypothetical protein